MASRIFWILLASAALVGSIAYQERDWLFSFAGEAGDVGIERATDRAVQARIDQAVERSFDRMTVVDSDGRAIDVAPQTKRDLGNAVRRLVAAESELALMRVRGATDAAVQEARSRSDAARAEVERLKGEIEGQEQLTDRESALVRQQIQQQVRETVRAVVRN